LPHRAIEIKETVMADDPTHRGVQDRCRISLAEEHEVRCRTQADRVREHLGIH
jgi:hypothetical protein